MYPGCGVVVKQPFREPGGGFKKILDDRPPIIKQLRDDNRFKKLRDDLPKGPRDPKLPRDPGPIKGAFDPMPIGRPEILRRPGTLQPFSLATPHHAPVAPPGMGGSTNQGLTGLEQQWLDLEAAIAEAHAVVAQAQADIARLQEAREGIAQAYDELLRQSGGSA
jgi:hypothetical protein